jgi:hypothetical protein
MLLKDVHSTCTCVYMYIIIIVLMRNCVNDCLKKLFILHVHVQVHVHVRLVFTFSKLNNKLCSIACSRELVSFPGPSHVQVGMGLGTRLVENSHHEDEMAAATLSFLVKNLCQFVHKQDY